MALIEVFLLALALSVDSLVVSTASTFKSKMPYRKGVLMAFVFGVFQGGFPLLGALLGVAFQDFVSTIDHWIAFGLLLFVGGKMIWDAFHSEEDDRPLDVTKFGTMCILGVATSIDAFVVGISLGFSLAMSQILFTVLVIGVVTMLLSLVGVFFGKRNLHIPDKVASSIAGLVLIGLGTYTLLEHMLF